MFKKNILHFCKWLSVSVVLNVKRCLDCREYVAYKYDRVECELVPLYFFGPNIIRKEVILRGLCE